MGIERRVSQDLSVQIRAADKRTIEGYASVSNVPTVIWDFEEVIAPGAFARALDGLSQGKQDVRSLFNHDANFVLGRTARGNNPGTLILREDNKGLWTETTPPEPGKSPMADSVVESIRRGDVSGMSFAFTVKRQEWELFDIGSEQMDRRVITEIGQLYDIGPVTYPAYDQTTVGLRIKNDALKEHSEARNRWQERSKSRIVVPKEFEHSLFEMRSGELWVNTDPNPTIDEATNEATKNEETEIPVTSEEATPVEIVAEEGSQESGEAQVDPVIEEPVAEIDEQPVEALSEDFNAESETRHRQISLKRKIAQVSLKTRLSLIKK